MADWILNGESGSSVRAKLNTIPNDGTTATGFAVSGADWLARPPTDFAGIRVQGGPEGGPGQLKGGDATGANDGGQALVQGGSSDGTAGTFGGSARVLGGDGETGGDVLLQPGTGSVDDGIIQLFGGQYKLWSLPSSDPGIPGRLYHTSGTVKISL